MCKRSFGTICFALNSAFTVPVFLYLLYTDAASSAADQRTIPLGDLGSAASWVQRLVVHACLTVLLVWEGPGLLDFIFLGCGLLYVFIALDVGEKSGAEGINRWPIMEWSMAATLASVAVGLQAARWRARVWVEQTLVSGDLEEYAARCVTAGADRSHSLLLLPFSLFFGCKPFGYIALYFINTFIYCLEFGCSSAFICMQSRMSTFCAVGQVEEVGGVG